MGTSLSKFCPSLSREKVVIGEVKYIKEDIKQYDFDGLIHDELATIFKLYILNIQSYNICFFTII